MKRSTYSFYGKMLIALGFAATSSAAYAATYTAVASGNYTSAATWGGIAPPTTISGDNIIIPVGVTVNMNQDVMVNGGGSTVTVLGTLTSGSSGSDLMVTGNALLTGAGNITADSLVLGGSSATLGASGTINARALTSNGLTIAGNPTINAAESVTLGGGLTDLSSVTLNLANGGTVNVAGGSVNIGSSAIVNMPDYNVKYTGTSANAGLELQGSGLKKVTIDVPASSTVTLNGDLTMNDMLTLNSGTLDLNGNNLTIGANGNVAASGSGVINSTSGSDITLNSGNMAGSLRFGASGNTVDDLNVNLSNSSATANIGSDLNVAGTLNLQSGKLNIGSNELALGATGNVTGGSASSYVVTRTDGYVSADLTPGSNATFQIGTSANYAPVKVTLNPGSASGEIDAGVNTGVRSGGSVGTDLALTQPVVNATWFVDNSASSNINMNIEPMWSAGMEVNGMDRNHVFVSSNTNGTWDATTGGSATTSGGMFTTVRNNVTSSDGAYAVMDTAVVNHVPELTKTTVQVYPNPAEGMLHFNTDTREPMQVTVYDVTGHVVKSASVTGKTLNVAGLASGFYTVQFHNASFNATAKFVKQ